jgi:hypothetical protein
MKAGSKQRAQAGEQVNRKQGLMPLRPPISSIRVSGKQDKKIESGYVLGGRRPTAAAAIPIYTQKLFARKTVTVIAIHRFYCRRKSARTVTFSHAGRLAMENRHRKYKDDNKRFQ